MSAPELKLVRVSDGGSVSLDSIWKDRRVALVFLRHLGCRFCLEQTDALVNSGVVRRLQEFNVTLVAVSLGTLEQAREWIQKTGFSGELYIDTSTDGSNKAIDQLGSSSYGAFRLKRGVEYVRQHKETQDRAASVAAKFPDAVPKQNGDVLIYPGDIFQVGGAFVVGPGNTCDLAVRSEYAGDLLDLEALEIAATGKASGGAEYVYPSTQAWATKLNVAKRVEAVKSDVSLWAHRVRPIVVRYWRCVAGASALVAAVEAARQRKIVASAGFLGVASLIGYSGVTSQRRDRPINKVKVFTAKQLDEMVMKAGLMECDCGGLISAIPMDSLLQGSEDLALPRARAVTWDAKDLDGTAPNEFQAMLCYVRHFLAKPHPLVGRPGPVCPFVPKSLQLDTVKMSVVRTRAIPRHDLRRALGELLVDFIPQFEAMEPTTGRQRQFKTVIFVFPDVAVSDATDVIDGAQADAKANFVAKGLMVGEFHAANNASGLRNDSFFPLRTPFPCLAVRHMVPGDFVFMTLDNYPIDLQRKFLRSFLDVFGDEDREEVRSATKKLAELPLES